MLLKHIFKPTKENIKEVSNIIQYDSMGYPLRLVINSKGKQEWVDTEEKENDKVLIWSTKEEK